MPAFHPKCGMVLLCDFSGFRPPEMTKKRPAVIAGEEGAGRAGTCLVVPLSTVAPDPVMGFHHGLDRASLPTSMWNEVTWAKCDMVTTVASDRLDRVMNGRDALGKRYCVTHQVVSADLAAIRRGVLVALHMSALAAHVADGGALMRHDERVPAMRACETTP